MISLELAQKYIELRNPNAVVYAAPQKKEEHIHIHFVFSGTEFKSRKTLRMDDRSFKSLRRAMEQFQLEQFPDLKHSIVYLGKQKNRNSAIQRDQNTRKEKFFQWLRRNPNKQSEKVQLKELVKVAYSQAQSKEAFYELLKDQGLELYQYRGKIRGIRGKRKYRFTALGISKLQLLGLDQLEQRNRDLDLLRGEDDLGRGL